MGWRDRLAWGEGYVLAGQLKKTSCVRTSNGKQAYGTPALAQQGDLGGWRRGGKTQRPGKYGRAEGKVEDVSASPICYVSAREKG